VGPCPAIEVPARTLHWMTQGHSEGRSKASRLHAADIRRGQGATYNRRRKAENGCGRPYCGLAASEGDARVSCAAAAVSRCEVDGTRGRAGTASHCRAIALQSLPGSSWILLAGPRCASLIEERRFCCVLAATVRKLFDAQPKKSAAGVGIRYSCVYRNLVLASNGSRDPDAAQWTTSRHQSLCWLDPQNPCLQLVLNFGSLL
jgi:hypothetical protein